MSLKHAYILVCFVGKSWRCDTCDEEFCFKSKYDRHIETSKHQFRTRALRVALNAGVASGSDASTTTSTSTGASLLPSSLEDATSSCHSVSMDEYRCPLPPHAVSFLWLFPTVMNFTTSKPLDLLLEFCLGVLPYSVSFTRRCPAWNSFQPT